MRVIEDCYIETKTKFADADYGTAGRYTITYDGFISHEDSTPDDYCHIYARAIDPRKMVIIEPLELIDGTDNSKWCVRPVWDTEDGIGDICYSRYNGRRMFHQGLLVEEPEPWLLSLLYKAASRDIRDRLWLAGLIGDSEGEIWSGHQDWRKDKELQAEHHRKWLALREH